MAAQQFPLFQEQIQKFLRSLNPNNIEEMATRKIPQFQFKFGYPEIPWGNFFQFFELTLRWASTAESEIARTLP